MEATLTATPRNERGKNPATVYGSSSGAEKAPPLAVSVDPKVLTRILRSESGVNTLIGLTIEGVGDTRVLVKDYQVDPVSSRLLHADFYRIAMDRPIVVTVPAVLRGEAKGVKQQGGLVDFVQRAIEIECLPGDIPEHVDVDLTELLIGQAVRVRDVAVNVPWTAVSDPETMLVHVVAPRAVETPAEEAAPAATAEPEVIKRGKTEKAEE
jgi:large subunit ribosomal protein L25